MDQITTASVTPYRVLWWDSRWCGRPATSPRVEGLLGRRPTAKRAPFGQRCVAASGSSADVVPVSASADKPTPPDATASVVYVPTVWSASRRWRLQELFAGLNAVCSSACGNLTLLNLGLT